MELIDKLELRSESYVHCISFNYFGDRMALSCADQSIQVWNLEENKWKLSAKWSAHNGAVFKVRWAHPEFGTILASCSFDKSVKIYEENPQENSWPLLASLVESKEPIEDIQFAPHHLRLMLAACSSNGEIRIYEPSSVVNLKVWSVTKMFSACALGSNCIAWNPAVHEPPMLLIGNNDAQTATEKFGKNFDVDEELLQLWAVSEDTKEWEKKCVPARIHERSIVDISWAQLMGRSKHLVASCSYDGIVVIWRIDGSTGAMESEINIRDPIGGPVWRVSWDVLGTMLTTINGDGTVKVWKRNLQKEWVEVGALKNR